MKQLNLSTCVVVQNRRTLSDINSLGMYYIHLQVGVNILCVPKWQVRVNVKSYAAIIGTDR